MRIGIDLGGTKIEGILLGSDGSEIARVRVATPHSYEGTLTAISNLVRELEHRSTARTGVQSVGDANSPSVGVGIPGALVPSTGLVKNANSVWLIGKPLQRDLESRLSRPIRIANDANCFALSEATNGAGAGAHIVFGAILGTGVGGGITIDGQMVNGANLIAGEWGHNPLPWPDENEFAGPPCYCGKKGCIETWISGPGFEKEFARVTSRSLTPREIVGAAENNDHDAQAALDRYTTRLAKSLATVVNIVDPDVIVLGGGMSKIPRLADLAKAKLDEWVFSDASATRVEGNIHGDSSGVRGAAWLWPKR